MQYFFYHDKAGREIGPLDLVTLSKFRMAGVLDGETPVRTADSAEWKPCREVIADSPTSSTAPTTEEAVKKSSNEILIALIAIVIVVIIATRSRTQHTTEASNPTVSSPSLFSQIWDAQDALRKQKAISQANACINNLRQIDAAANQFALESRKKTGDRINFPSELTPYIKLNSSGQMPPCPAGGTYTCATVGPNPTCSLGTMVTPNHVLP